MRTNRTITVAAVAALALTGLTACAAAQKAGNDAAHAAAALPADALAALGLANTHLQSNTSAKISGTIEMPGAATPETLSGAMAWDSSARFTGNVTGAPGMAQLSSTGSVPFLMTDGVIYMKISNATVLAQTGGKEWMKLDFAELASLSKNAQASSMGSGMGNMLKQLSPVHTVQAMLKAQGVKAVGQETMDGQQTTHYSGHLTLDQILAAMPGLTDAQRKTMGDADKSVGMTGEDVDIWLNSDALPVRVLEHASTQKGDMQDDRHFSDYGVQVPVTVPSASDTIDIAAQLKAASGGAS